VFLITSAPRLFRLLERLPLKGRLGTVRRPGNRNAASGLRVVGRHGIEKVFCLQDLTMNQIGDYLGIDESRVLQIILWLSTGCGASAIDVVPAAAEA
jgi:hypothetical protein